VKTAAAAASASTTQSGCKDYSGNSFCEHKRQRSRCKVCGGSGICEHQRRRSEFKDCAKKRMLEGHGGPQRKRYKHEERGVNQVNVSDLVTTPAPHPSPGKKSHQVPALCKHQKWRNRCKDCGRSGLCEHQRQNMSRFPCNFFPRMTCHRTVNVSPYKGDCNCLMRIKQLQRRFEVPNRPDDLANRDKIESF